MADRKMRTIDVLPRRIMLCCGGGGGRREVEDGIGVCLPIDCVDYYYQV